MYVLENLRPKFRLLNLSELQKLYTTENKRISNNNLVEALTFGADFCS
jgi:hypothetical protein